MTILSFSRRVYGKLYQLAYGHRRQLPPLKYISERSEANTLICQLLQSDKPCMICRFGSTELDLIVNYLSTKMPLRHWKYVTGYINDYEWNPQLMGKIETYSGFFPPTKEMLTRYCEMTIQDMAEMDLLGSWRLEEHYVDTYMTHLKAKVRLGLLEPNYATDDASGEWTHLLKGKKVVVVHPFAETIERQYKKRRLLFRSPDLMPDFDLRVVKAVQSLGGVDNGYQTWFEALEGMEREMDAESYDIAIIGCGAYGFNLAAHAKRTGHKAIHLGGATQLLFGIRGKRWEEREDYLSIMNEHWCRPAESEHPANFKRVEGGCYW